MARIMNRNLLDESYITPDAGFAGSPSDFLSLDYATPDDGFQFGGGIQNLVPAELAGGFDEIADFNMDTAVSPLINSGALTGDFNPVAEDVPLTDLQTAQIEADETGSMSSSFANELLGLPIWNSSRGLTAAADYLVNQSAGKSPIEALAGAIAKGNTAVGDEALLREKLGLEERKVRAREDEVAGEVESRNRTLALQQARLNFEINKDPSLNKGQVVTDKETGDVIGTLLTFSDGTQKFRDKNFVMSDSIPEGGKIQSGGHTFNLGGESDRKIDQEYAVQLKTDATHAVKNNRLVNKARDILKRPNFQGKLAVPFTGIAGIFNAVGFPLAKKSYTNTELMDAVLSKLTLNTARDYVDDQINARELSFIDKASGDISISPQALNEILDIIEEGNNFVINANETNAEYMQSTYGKPRDDSAQFKRFTVLGNLPTDDDPTPSSDNPFYK